MEPTHDDGPGRSFGAPDLALSGSIDRLTLERAVGDLPAGYRLIFLLHDVEGYEHNEIATMLECSIGTSKSQLHKARLKLRDVLPHFSSAGRTAMTGDRENMSCQEFQEQLADLIGSGEDASAHPHLQTCETCRALLAELQTIAGRRQAAPPHRAARRGPMGPHRACYQKGRRRRQAVLIPAGVSTRRRFPKAAPPVPSVCPALIQPRPLPIHPPARQRCARFASRVRNADRSKTVPQACTEDQPKGFRGVPRT